MLEEPKKQVVEQVKERLTEDEHDFDQVLEVLAELIQGGVVP